MNFGEFFDKLAHRSAKKKSALFIKDNDIAEDKKKKEDSPGYFQIRLADMFLTDERRWHQEIVPATFFLADFKYAAGDIRQPYFVSSDLLGGLPQGIDRGKIRTKFTDTLIVGPTPYIGGDVGLFVGLFQTTIEDHRRALFSVFEKLFGSFDLGALTQYIKVADKLTSEILICLGAEDVKCLVAERLIIGHQALPPSGHFIFFGSQKETAKTDDLIIKDGTLHHATTSLPVDDLDYCLVKVERLAARNDYTTMEFHRTWMKAREKMMATHDQEAQVHMLECSLQVLASPDLTEDHKVSLIQFYQAKLLDIKQLAGTRGEISTTTRSGEKTLVRQMQTRAAASANTFNRQKLSDPYEEIARLTTHFSTQGPTRKNPVTEEDIAKHIKEIKPGSSTPTAETLVRAIAAGSLAA